MNEAGLLLTIQVKRFIPVERSPVGRRIIEGESWVFPSAVLGKFRPVPEAEARLNEGEIHGVNSVPVFFCRIARDPDNWMPDKRGSTVILSMLQSGADNTHMVFPFDDIRRVFKGVLGLFTSLEPMLQSI